MKLKSIKKAIVNKAIKPALSATINAIELAISNIPQSLKDEWNRKGGLTLLAEAMAVVGGSSALFIVWIMTMEYIK
jgi:hypothetical protein